MSLISSDELTVKFSVISFSSITYLSQHLPNSLNFHAILFPRKGEIWEHIKTASIILGSCSAIAAAYFVVGSFMMQELDAKMKHRFDHAKTHIDAKMDEQGFREAIGMLFLLFILMLFLFALVDADDCKGKSIRKRKKKPSLLHN